jgi:5-hydroxyisourate hydrolase-like protein (transthyretin family)
MKTRQRRGLIVAIALALLIVAAWFVRRTPVAATRTPATQPIAKSSPRREAEDARSEPAPAAAATRSAEAVQTFVSSGSHYTIHVLDALTREPIADAEVRWVSSEEGENWLDDEDAAIAASGRSARTDAGGRVEIPVDGGRILVHATGGSRFGTRYFFADSSRYDRLELLVWPEFDVSVRVVDPAGGAAAEVPVTLRRIDEGSRRRESTTVTDAAGTAVLRHVGQKMAEHHSYRLGHHEDDAAWEIGLDLCTVENTATRVELGAAPRDPIQLTLPETGSVVVEGVDIGGKPVALDGDGCLTTPPGSEGEINRLHNWFSIRHHFDLPERCKRGRLDGGRLVFPRVALGLDLVAYVQRNDASELFHVEGAGPKLAGEQVTLKVVVGPEALTLHGRVVDDQRQPIVNARLIARLATVHISDDEVFYSGPEVGYSELGVFTTDGDGRFAIDVSALDRKWRYTASLILSVAPNRPEARLGVVELPADLTSGDFDFGDFVLSPAPLLASGSVVDEFDRPVSHCHIEGPTWKSMKSGVETLTDDLGRFELRGILLDKVVGMWLRAPLHVDRRMSVARGTRDLVVRMPRSGGVKARIGSLQGGAGSHFSLSLHHEDDGSDGAGDNVSTGLDAGEEFFHDGRWPGQWTMVIGNSGRDLLRLTGITIRGGEITDLGDVSLDSSATAIHLTVKSAVTGELLSGAYLVRPRGTGAIDQLFNGRAFGNDAPRRFDKGEIRIVDLHDSVDVVMIGPEHRAEVVLARAGDQEIRLRPALHLPLRIAEFRGLPPRPAELRLIVALGEEHFDPFTMVAPELQRTGWSSPFDTSGGAEVFVPAAGRWSVRWIVVSPTANGSTAVEFTGRETTIDLRDEDHPAELLLHPDRDTSKPLDAQH